MIGALVLAAALTPPASVIRGADPSHGGPRFVRLALDVTVYGIAGRGEMLVDRRTGRYVRRFDAGPASEREGFDGVRAWRADATGMARVQGNADERGAILAWSSIVARPRRARGAARAPAVTIDPRSGLVESFVRSIGQNHERTSLTDFRETGGLVIPFALTDTSENGVWTARVRDVQTPAAVPDDAFAPPPEPRDATLRGVTRVPLARDAEFPVVAVSVNGGSPLRFLLDTGGQNVISPQAAARLGMRSVGDAAVGGAGASLARVRFATARSVRVGGAEMRDQPFIVLDLGAAVHADGVIGYELLARFAARLDFEAGVLELAPRASAFRRPNGAAREVPFVFDDRQPQVEGSLDGIPGAMTIDTGSTSAVDVNSPFVRAHGLRERYHAGFAGTAFSGVGGPVRAYYARAKVLRLGRVTVRDVALLLTDATAGAEANPSVAANVGDRVLRRFALVLDYRNRSIRFDPVAGARAPR